MYTARLQVRFDDVDGAGIVYFPRYLHYCHVAMEDFFNACGPVPYAELITGRHRGFPTVHLEADYRQPVRYGQVLLIDVDVEHLGRSSIKFRYRFRADGAAAELFTARITTVYADLVGMTPLPVDPDVRAVLEQHRAG